MIRYSLLFLFLSFLCVYSFRDWYKALCGMLILLAVMERPDMPKSMLGIGGLSPFNIVLLFILMGWFLQKRKEMLQWNYYPAVNRLLVIYMIIIFLSSIRMMFDYAGFVSFSVDLNWPLITKGDLIKDDFINAIKFMIPGLLLAHGTNSEERASFALKCILFSLFLLIVQITIKMLPVLVSGEDVATRSFRVLNRDIGYHRGELAPLMASAAWAFMVARTSKINININLGGFAWGTLAVVLTGGRGGAMAWAACGMVFGFIRWRKILFLAPLVVLVVISFVPSIADRYTEGFSEDSHSGVSEARGLDTIDESGRDLYAISSGRVVVWPRVLEYIAAAPVIGYGRKAMIREGVNQSLVADGTFSMHDSMFMHPHNAYLEQFLDNGILGSFFILGFFITVGWLALKKLRDNSLVGSIEHTIASITLGFIIVQMAHSLTADSFYPKQVHTFMWCSIGLFIATHGWARKKAQENETADENKPDVPKQPNYYY